MKRGGIDAVPTRSRSRRLEVGSSAASSEVSMTKKTFSLVGGCFVERPWLSAGELEKIERS